LTGTVIVARRNDAANPSDAGGAQRGAQVALILLLGGDKNDI